MKIKVIFAALAMLTIQAVSAQNIIGVGSLKIGMSEQSFLDLDEVKNKTIKDSSAKNYGDSDYVVYKKTTQSNVEDYAKIYDKERTRYEFKMSIGVADREGKDLYTTLVDFYKDKLIHVQVVLNSADADFQKILTEKYGKPVTLDKVKKVVCQNGYGAKTVHNDGFFTYDWGTKNTVNASLMYGFSDCGRMITMGYSVSDGKKYKEMLDNERKIEDLTKQENIKSKASISKF
jgi:hypothetical protein